MTFKYLESGIPEGRVEDYLQLSERLHEPTKTVLPYTLDVAAHLNNLGLNEDYALFGGYAVLSHLMREQGEHIASLWRGSNDIDIAGTMRVMTALRSGYDVHSCLQSPNIKDKATIKLATDGSEECRIDFSTGDFKKRFKNIETNVHFGVPLNVIDPLSLIQCKLMTPKDELQHAGDIVGMLYVLEKRGYTPRLVMDYFAGSGNSKELYDRMKISKEAFKDDRLGLFPTKVFSSELERLLHRSRPVTNR